MTRNSYLVTLSIILIGGLWLVYQSHWRHAAFIIAPSPFLLIFLMFYPAIYMLKSLSWEWKVTPQLWLHCPQPAWMLLSSKMLVSLFQMLVIMIIAAALLLWGIFSSSLLEQLHGFTPQTLFSAFIEVGFYAALFTFALSIYIGSWATLISVVTAATQNILGRFRWLAGVGAFLTATWGIGQLQQTWFYERITHWGLLNISLHNLPQVLMIPRTDVRLDFLYVGEILFYLLITAALLALSAWLIDNKVEV